MYLAPLPHGTSCAAILAFAWGDFSKPGINFITQRYVDSFHHVDQLAVETQTSCFFSKTDHLTEASLDHQFRIREV
jgi:hypothetical protein